MSTIKQMIFLINAEIVVVVSTQSQNKCDLIGNQMNKPNGLKTNICMSQSKIHLNAYEEGKKKRIK